jgi:histidinol-phosphatase (PHP family)
LISFPDLHTHSTCSFDGHDSILAMAGRAAALGLPGLAVTEHIEWDPRSKARGWFDYHAILGQVEQARAAHPGLKVWMSVEVGWDPRYEAEIRQFLAGHRFDFVLGALHAVEGRDVGPELFSGISLEEAGRRYLAAAAGAVKTGLFDVLAHADLPKRYGITHYRQAWDAKACASQSQALCQALVEAGTVLELNTSGLRQAPKECLPGPFLLQCYHQAGGQQVALGSDAHSLGHVGHGFAEAAALAQGLGLQVLREPPSRA